MSFLGELGQKLRIINRAENEVLGPLSKTFTVKKHGDGGALLFETQGGFDWLSEDLEGINIVNVERRDGEWKVTRKNGEASYISVLSLTETAKVVTFIHPGPAKRLLKGEKKKGDRYSVVELGKVVDGEIQPSIMMIIKHGADGQRTIEKIKLDF